MDDERDGYAVEDDVRRIAAELGIADFVYRVPVVHGGSGSDEPGDALLISGSRGAILQVKARFTAAATDPPQRIHKRLEKAYRQGIGSRRKIIEHRDAGTPLQAMPLRAAQLDENERDQMALPLDGPAEDWPTIVVIDHSGVAGISPPHLDAFWVTFDDWLVLNQALRSVTGLLAYVQRVLDHGGALAVPLGSEAERFRQIVAADASYAAAGNALSKPWLNTDALDDPDGASCYRQLLEGVWPAGAPHPSTPASEVREIVEFLDGIPPGLQVAIGRWVLRKRTELRNGASWSSGVDLIDGERLLVFACTAAAHHSVQSFEANVAALTAVRLDEAAEQAASFTRALGVGAIVGGDGSVGYFYALIREPIHVPKDVRSTTIHERGRLDLQRGKVAPIRAGRNELCPCGSGLKFKRCIAQF